MLILICVRVFKIYFNEDELIPIYSYFLSSSLEEEETLL